MGVTKADGRGHEAEEGKKPRRQSLVAWEAPTVLDESSGSTAPREAPRKGPSGEKLPDAEEAPSASKPPPFGDPTTEAKDPEWEALLHLACTTRLVLRTCPFMALATAGAFAATAVLPAASVVAVYWLLLMELVSMASRRRAAVHGPLSAGLVGATCAVFYLWAPVLADSAVVDVALQCALTLPGVVLREAAYGALVHRRGAGASLAGGLGFAVVCAGALCAVLAGFTAGTWWPETAAAGTWQSYAWTCAVAPLVGKLTALSWAGLERLRARKSDVIHCHMVVWRTLVCSSIGGWAIYSAPTLTQAVLALLADIALHVLLQAVRREWRVFFRHGAAPRVPTATETGDLIVVAVPFSERQVDQLGLAFERVITGPTPTYVYRRRPTQEWEWRVNWKVVPAEEPAREADEKPVCPAEDSGPSAPEGEGVDSPEPEGEDATQKTGGAPRRTPVDVMLRGEPLDPLEVKVQELATGAAARLGPSLSVAALVALAPLLTTVPTSPTRWYNFVVLLVDDLVHVAEGYVLLVGAQRAHGRSVPYASLRRRWRLYLDRNVAAWLTYSVALTVGPFAMFSSLVMLGALEGAL